MASEQRAAVDGRDQFSFSYFAWIVLVCLLFASGRDLDRLFNLYLLLVPLLYIPALAVTIYWIIAMIRNLLLRRWRRVISILAAPLAAYLLFAAANAAGVNSEWIRFELWKHRYVDEIGRLANTDAPRIKLFDWGQTGGAGVPNFAYTLVYDESDEIVRPPSERSTAWQDRASKLCPDTTMCATSSPPSGIYVTVKKLEGHFYLVTEAW
jgi:hypothetical protein